MHRPLAAQALLTMGFLGSIGFLGQYPALPFRDFTLMCVLVLYAWLAFSKETDSEWALRVFVPVFGLLLFTVFYAYVFTLRVDVSVMPSVLSQRKYLYFLLGPVVYMLYRRGWTMEDFRRIFVVSVVLVLLNELVYDVVFSPQSLLLSGQFFVLDLSQVAEQSNALRIANTSALFAVLYFSRRLFQRRDVPVILFNLSMVMLAVLILAITIPRGLLFSSVAALLVYTVFLSRPDRARLAAVMLPLYAVIVALLEPSIAQYFANTFSQDATWAVRENTASAAWQSIREYPLLGIGSDSDYSVSLQNLFGDTFYVEDIGVLGVAFQYGAVGLVLYAVLVGWLIIRLLGMKWSRAVREEPVQNTFVWALFLLCFIFVFASPLQASFIYSVGLPIGTFAWGILMAHGHGTREARRWREVEEHSADSVSGAEDEVPV